MLSQELATYLASQSIGTVASDIFYNRMPDVDNCVVIFDSGGLPGNLKQSHDYPTVQIRSRNLVASGAYNKIAAIYNVLQGLHNVNLTTIHVIDCASIQSAPINIGQDLKQRQEYTINFQLTVVNPTAHRE